jgi:hypothetical protein
MLDDCVVAEGHRHCKIDELKRAPQKAWVG